MRVMYIIFRQTERQDCYRAANHEQASGKSIRSFLLVVPLCARLHSPPDLIFFALLFRHFHILSL